MTRVDNAEPNPEAIPATLAGGGRTMFVNDIGFTFDMSEDGMSMAGDATITDALRSMGTPLPRPSVLATIADCVAGIPAFVATAPRLAVTLDIGSASNVHPPDKQTVGHRLALAARHMVYGEDVAFASPLFRQASSELQPDGNSALRVWFDHATGLMAKGTEVTGFEIAGADEKYFPADAKIEGSSVVISSPEVRTPVLVRYGWAANPTCNLFNKDGLPASPFQAPE